MSVRVCVCVCVRGCYNDKKYKILNRKVVFVCNVK